MTLTRFPWLTCLALLATLILPGHAAALWQDDELLEADKAFAFTATSDSGSVRVQWKVADGYYMYRSRIQFRTDTPGVDLGEPRFPEGKIKDDEFFGRVEIYRGTVEIDVPVTASASAAGPFKLIAVSQGCADQGVCYPPHTQTAELALPDAPAAAAPAAADKDPIAPLTSLSRELGFDNSADDFLDPDVAFRPLLTASDDGTTLIAHWDIEPGYYLYRDKFRFEIVDGAGVTLQAPQFPAGDIKEDETFGRVEVFHNAVDVRIPLARSNTAPMPITLKLTYQGCAEAGICYPPQHKMLEAALPMATGDGSAAASTDEGAPASADDAPITEQDRIVERLATGNVTLTMLSFFGFGLLLAFTPCVFPMIPILSSIIIGQGEHITTMRAFTLSLIYVLAMALTYTGAGVIAGLSGENLQAAFQNPWILGSFATVFVLLSLSMFGFYELQMPAALQSKLSEVSSRQQGGSLVGVAIMGFLSALIVGPCVAAPLAAALIYIGQTGDPYLGGSALFALSMGMGLPLLAIGTGAGKLLPRAGGWMNAVKAIFGVLLLAVAVWMLERIIPPAASMTLWAILLITSAVYMGALERLDIDATGWHKLWKGVGLIFLVYGVLILAGVAAGGKDVFQPLRGTGFVSGGTTAVAAQKTEFRTIKSVADLEREVALAAGQGKGVMLDFYADWCTDCHRMEKYTFSDPAVVAALENVVPLKADVTANDEVDKALLKHFKLHGPPSILFFDRSGAERDRHRVMGYMNAEEFSAHITKAIP